MASKQVTRLREDIHQFIKDEDFELAMNALREGLGAMQTVRKNRADGAVTSVNLLFKIPLTGVRG